MTVKSPEVTRILSASFVLLFLSALALSGCGSSGGGGGEPAPNGGGGAGNVTPKIVDTSPKVRCEGESSWSNPSDKHMKFAVERTLNQFLRGGSGNALHEPDALMVSQVYGFEEGIRTRILGTQGMVIAQVDQRPYYGFTSISAKNKADDERGYLMCISDFSQFDDLIPTEKDCKGVWIDSAGNENDLNFVIPNQEQATSRIVMEPSFHFGVEVATHFIFLTVIDPEQNQEMGNLVIDRYFQTANFDLFLGDTQFVIECTGGGIN